MTWCVYFARVGSCEKHTGLHANFPYPAETLMHKFCVRKFGEFPTNKATIRIIQQINHDMVYFTGFLKVRNTARDVVHTFEKA